MHCLRVRSSTIRGFCGEGVPTKEQGRQLHEGVQYDRICLSRTDIAARRQRAGNAGPGQDLAPGKQTSFAAELTGPRKPRRLADACKEEIFDSAEQAARLVHFWSTIRIHQARSFRGDWRRPPTDNNDASIDDDDESRARCPVSSSLSPLRRCDAARSTTCSPRCL